MVMNAPAVATQRTVSPSITTSSRRARIESSTAPNCVAHTESTSGTRRLNSAHARRGGDGEA